MFAENLFATVPFAMVLQSDDPGPPPQPGDENWCDFCPDNTIWSDQPVNDLGTIKCGE